MANRWKVFVVATALPLMACAQNPEPQEEAKREANAQAQQEQVQPVKHEQSQAASDLKEPMAPEAENTRITANVEMQPVPELSPSEELGLSRAAGRILWHVRDARIAIQNKNSEQAKQEIQKGQLLVQIVERTVPEAKVKTIIKSGDLTYEDVDQVKPLLIPIHDELEKVSVIGPLLQSRKETAQKQAGTGPVAITDSDLAYTRVLLDVANVRTGLKMASEQLGKGNMEQADDALAGVQNQVVLRYVEADLPLVAVSENLILAKVRAEQDDASGAQAALKAAADDLQQYSKSAKEARSKEAQKLSQDIRSFASSVDKNLEQAGDKIENWWGQVNGWGG